MILFLTHKTPRRAPAELRKRSVLYRKLAERQMGWATKMRSTVDQPEAGDTGR